MSSELQGEIDQIFGVMSAASAASLLGDLAVTIDDVCAGYLSGGDWSVEAATALALFDRLLRVYLNSVGVIEARGDLWSRYQISIRMVENAIKVSVLAGVNCPALLSYRWPSHTDDDAWAAAEALAVQPKAAVRAAEILAGRRLAS